MLPFSAESNLRSLFIYDRSSHIIQTCCLPKKKLFQSMSHFINLTGDESSRKSTSSVLINDTGLFLQSTTGGLHQKSIAVSGGTADGAFNTGVVLVAGTVTINNSYVTTNSVGIASISTSGGTPGTYTITCTNGSYTVTSTSALDTSTLNVFFIKGV